MTIDTTTHDDSVTVIHGAPTARRKDSDRPGGLAGMDPEYYGAKSGEMYPMYVALSLRDGRLWVDRVAECDLTCVDSHNRVEMRWYVGSLTDESADELLDRVAPYAAAIMADSETYWDHRGNYVGEIFDAAEAAKKAIEKICDEYKEDEIVISTVAETGEADPRLGFDITAETTDDELRAFAREYDAEFRDAFTDPGRRGYHTVYDDAVRVLFDHRGALVDAARDGDGDGD